MTENDLKKCSRKGDISSLKSTFFYKVYHQLWERKVTTEKER